jgi:hypothetical protein
MKFFDLFHRILIIVSRNKSLYCTAPVKFSSVRVWQKSPDPHPDARYGSSSSPPPLRIQPLELIAIAPSSPTPSSSSSARAVGRHPTPLRASPVGILLIMRCGSSSMSASCWSCSRHHHAVPAATD